MRASSLSHDDRGIAEAHHLRGRPVTIRGDGVAAYCCAHLLNKAGFQIDLQPVDRPRLPVILLSDQALALVRGIFDQPDLFAPAQRIRRRIVAWGHDAAVTALEHSAVLVSEEMLLDAIRPRLPAVSAGNAGWTIHSCRPLPSPATDHCFGTRGACAVPVTLKPGSDQAACWIESLDEGWLFLTPEWLLAVGASAGTLLNRSRVVAQQIEDHGALLGQFPAFARIASPLCGSDWLACGTAAMAFDPICGDGTAHAIREAILASAVIRAMAEGGRPDELLSHYEARLTAGFERHLMVCREFYISGGSGPLWASEAAAIDRGIQWCGGVLTNQRSFRYRLRGFELEFLG